MLKTILALIGFSAVVAQVVLMRGLLVLFYGNEVSLGIMLAMWLLWTAVGSALAGRVAYQPTRVLAGLQVLVTLAFPMTILALRAGKSILQPIPGEVVGPGVMLATSLAALAPFCVISGALFAAGSRVYAVDSGASTSSATGSVYLLEAAGSGAGGLLASLLLVRWLNPFEIAAVLALLNAIAAVSLLARGTKRLATIGMLLAITYFLFPAASARLERSSLAHLWRGFELLATRNSIYGNLAVVGTHGTRSLFENGLILFSVPDPAAAEEAVHYALLEHPSPSTLLLIGAGVNGSLAQAFQHSSIRRVDYVELDPTVLQLARRYFPEEWPRLEADPRVHVHSMDGRLFVKTTAQKFDVIIVNLPDPQTAQLNRFYTAEFFREAAEKLNSGGLLSLQLRAAEDYISPELAEFLRCINRTLGEVFPEVRTIPGETVHFFAATQPAVLAAGSDELIARLRARNLHTSYVREYYIPFRMMPDRMLDLEQQIRPRAGTPVNHDFAPIAYYFDVVLWSTRFNVAYRALFQSLARVSFQLVMGLGVVLLLAVFVAVRVVRPQGRHRVAAGVCAGAMGFTLMAMEILLLFAFQAIYGYVYQQLAIIIAAFMAGMALGSWSSLRRPLSEDNMQTLAWLQGLAAMLPLFGSGLFMWFSHFTHGTSLILVTKLVFPALACCCGLLGGYQFPIASRAFFNDHSNARSVGAVYALDLVGAGAGALLPSIYLVPIFGLLRTALLIAVVDLVVALQAALSAWEMHSRPLSAAP